MCIKLRTPRTRPPARVGCPEGAGGAYFWNSRHQERKWPPSSSPRTQGESKTSPRTYQAKGNFRPLCSKPVCTLWVGCALTGVSGWRRAGVADPFRAKKLGWGVLGLIHVGAVEGHPSLPPRTRGGRPRRGRGGWCLWPPPTLKKIPAKRGCSTRNSSNLQHPISNPHHGA